MFIFVCTAGLVVVIFLCDCVTMRELADEYGGGFAQRERTARLELLRNGRFFLLDENMVR